MVDFNAYQASLKAVINDKSFMEGNRAASETIGEYADYVATQNSDPTKMLSFNAWLAAETEKAKKEKKTLPTPEVIKAAQDYMTANKLNGTFNKEGQFVPEEPSTGIFGGIMKFLGDNIPLVGVVLGLLVGSVTGITESLGGFGTILLTMLGVGGAVALSGENGVLAPIKNFVVKQFSADPKKEEAKDKGTPEGYTSAKVALNQDNVIMERDVKIGNTRVPFKIHGTKDEQGKITFTDWEAIDGERSSEKGELNPKITATFKPGANPNVEGTVDLSPESVADLRRAEAAYKVKAKVVADKNFKAGNIIVETGSIKQEGDEVTINVSAKLSPVAMILKGKLDKNGNLQIAQRAEIGEDGKIGEWKNFTNTVTLMDVGTHELHSKIIPQKVYDYHFPNTMNFLGMTMPGDNSGLPNLNLGSGVESPRIG